MLKGHLRKLDRSRNSHTKEVATRQAFHAVFYESKWREKGASHRTRDKAEDSVELVMKGCWHYVNNRFLSGQRSKRDDEKRHVVRPKMGYSRKGNGAYCGTLYSAVSFEETPDPKMMVHLPSCDCSRRERRDRNGYHPL